MQVVQHGTHLEIVRRWNGPRLFQATLTAVFGGLFFVAWSYQSVVFARFAEMPGLFPQQPMEQSLLFTWVPRLLFVAWLGLMYSVAAGWLNRTRIDVSHETFSIRHSPLPWWGNKTFPASDLTQLYAKDNIVSNRDGPSTTKYELHAITRDDRHFKLLTNLESSEQALYLEQEIEKYLGIKDSPVKSAIG